MRDKPAAEPRLRKVRSPAQKLALAILVGFLLAIPLFSVYLLNWDRQTQSETARNSIVEGWGGPQTIGGPLLVIPYQVQAVQTVEEGGKSVTKSVTSWQELVLSPETASLDTAINPSLRQRSIYEAVVYEASLKGKARFVMPVDLARRGVPVESLALDRAEIRFGLSDSRGLFGAPPTVSAGGKALRLEPGHGLPSTNNAGFYTAIDATSLRDTPIDTDFSYQFRGNGSLALAPRAGDTSWTVTSSWPSPSFAGGFLPTSRDVSAKGFKATYRIGNLALGQSLVASDAPSGTDGAAVVGVDQPPYSSMDKMPRAAASDQGATIDLIQPVDLYSQVNRATKYGFLFIGFTFAALLMFDVIGGVRVSTVEYLLVGAGLVLFFVLLLAFAEVIGFTPAYVVASAAIIGLITAYSAAVLKSWRRATYIGALLVGLYVVLYILLSLEAYSLLIGSVLLFAALAGVMYATRHLDWGAIEDRGGISTPAPDPEPEPEPADPRPIATIA